MFCWKRTVQTILFPDNNQFKMKKHHTPMIHNRTASDGEIIGLIKQRILSIPDPEILEDAEKWTKIIQPSGIDLRVGDQAWLMAGSARPMSKEAVNDVVARFAVKELDLASPTDLLRDSVYVIELQETSNSQRPMHFLANSKSSSGRLDLQTRLLTDGNPHYDSFHGPYSGRLYMEVVPNSFHCQLQKGTPLNQLRFSSGNPVMPDDEIRSVLKVKPLLYSKEGKPLGFGQVIVDGGLVLTVDLNGEHTDKPEIVGYRAKKSCGLKVDLQKTKQDSWGKFFDPIEKPKNGKLLLEPDYFYLLSTNEAIVLPPAFAGELAQFDPRVGHITSHYAGFFDPGFGYFPGKEEQGNTATLEVRVHNKAEIIRDGQPIAVLRVERMANDPLFYYGCPERSSNYSRQTGVRYGKHFKE